MDEVSLAYAKEHLEELIARATAGEDVRIATPDNRAIQLSVIANHKPSRRLGLLEGKMVPPVRLMEPMTETELAEWYGKA